MAINPTSIMKTSFILVFLTGISKVVAVETTHRPPHVAEDYTKHICKNSNRAIVAASIYQVLDAVLHYWCCECPAGTYVTKNCSMSSPNGTKCSTCPPKTYASEVNHDTACTKALDCRQLPYTRLVEGNAKENNKCPCIDGTYSLHPEVSGCKKHNECPKGFGVKNSGNSTHDVTCELCTEGLCSYEESSTQTCQKCDEVQKPTSAINVDLNVSMASTVPTSAAPQSEGCSPYPLWKDVVLIIGLVGWVLVAILCFALREELCEKYRNCMKEKERKQGELGSLTDDDEREDLLKGRQDDLGYATSSLTAFNHDNEKVKHESRQKEGTGRAENETTAKTKYDVQEQSATANEAIPHSTEVPDPKCKPQRYPKDEYKKIFLDLSHEIIFDPDKDGNCQFAAIAHGMNPEMSRENVQVEARKIRQDIVNYMKSSENHERFSKRTSLVDYFEKMSENAYGDHLTLQAAHELYGIQFKIIQTSETVQLVPPEPSHHILLGHVDEDSGMHYVCLKSIEEADGRLEATPPVDNTPPSTLTALSNSKSENGSVVKRAKDVIGEGPAPKLENGSILTPVERKQSQSDLEMLGDEQKRADLSQWLKENV